jgi:hypothetical protein
MRDTPVIVFHKQNGPWKDAIRFELTGRTRGEAEYTRHGRFHGQFRMDTRSKGYTNSTIKH